MERVLSVERKCIKILLQFRNCLKEIEKKKKIEGKRTNDANLGLLFKLLRGRDGTTLAAAITGVRLRITSRRSSNRRGWWVYGR